MIAAAEAAHTQKGKAEGQARGKQEREKEGEGEGEKEGGEGVPALWNSSHTFDHARCNYFAHQVK